jgi:uncharacterized protein YutE (UPF0331/DUF86 family)
VTVDPALVTRKLLLIAADSTPSVPWRARASTRMWGTSSSRAFVERYLERLIGRMIDVNYHVLTGTGQPPPSCYFVSFVRLGDVGALEPAFSREIARAAGLHNRIVHEYDGLDPVRVFDALTGALRDIPRYLDQVNAYLKRTGSV